MADVRELKDRAAKSLSKGRFEKAAEAYLELCELEPRDPQLRVRLGDVYVKLGRPAAAIEAYRIAAESFARDGFLPRAIAVCKLILVLDPSHVATQQTLAQLYAQKSGRPLEPPAPRQKPAAARGRPVEAPTARPAQAHARPAASSAGEAGERPVEEESAAASRPIEAAHAGAQPAGTSPTGEQGTTPGLDRVTELSLEDAPGGIREAIEAIAATGVDGQPPVTTAPVALEPPAGEPAPAAAPEPIREPSPLVIEPPAATPAAVRPADAASPEEEKGDQEGDDGIMFSGEPDQPAFSLADVELGEPELVGVDEPAASEAAAASDAALGSEVPQGGVWFAPPEGVEPPSCLADLGIAAIDEDEEIEVLTVTSDRPIDAARLPEIPLFSDLSREAFVELASQCSLRRFQPGEAAIEEGTVGTSFFVVCSGRFKVCKLREGEPVLVARLTEGAFFGEMALLSGAPRSASVVAEEEAECLEISAALLADLQRRHPHVGQVLKKFVRQRLLANVMATSPLFRPFTREERKALIERFKAREVAAGEALVEQGRISDGLYVVMAGELEVRRLEDGVAAPLARLKEGEIFGEISLLTKSAATATVVAVTRSTVLRLPRPAFDELISTHPQILMLVSELSDERLQSQQALSSEELLLV